MILESLLAIRYVDIDTALNTNIKKEPYPILTSLLKISILTSPPISAIKADLNRSTVTTHDIKVDTPVTPPLDRMALLTCCW